MKRLYWVLPKLRVESCAQTYLPREALGENSACKTGTVELMNPIPIPLTMRPTTI